MMPDNDLELLEQYLHQSSEEAFGELVHRHLDLVYSAALRQVRSPQLAEEVAQSVFTDLSRNAGRLLQGNTGTLTAWLYQVTRRTAVDVIRRESRRQLRETLAMELTQMNQQPSLWSQVEPLLDEAMETLEAPERTAILLRFFENKSLREVGQSLGTSEDAAQKRVSRAVDHLRDSLARRGVAVGASSLAAFLSANAVQSAPLGLGTAISAAAASGTALHTLSLTGATKLIAMTTMQKILISAAITAALGATLYETHRASRWRDQAIALQQQQDPLDDQIVQLQHERDDAASRLTALRQENDELRRSTADLPRLRGEVGRLRDESRELARLRTNAASANEDPQLESAFKLWAERASLLRQRLGQSPNQQIPELQFLAEKGWFDAVKGLDRLETDEDYRKALSNARNIAKNEFVGLAQKALRGYLDANGDQLPQDFAQLKPFFQSPVDDSVLQRYKLLQTGKLSDVPAGEYLVAETAPLIDEQSDAIYKFTLNGVNSHSGSPTEDAVKEAVTQYAAEHGDLLPTDLAQLTPYLKQSVDPDKFRAMQARVPPGVTTLRQLKAALR